MIFSSILKQFMSYLHIAEKNSIAKEVAQILSEGTKRVGTTLSKYNPVYLFDMDGEQHTFSSVRGHIFTNQLPPECKSWSSFDNKKILNREVPMIKVLGDGMQDLFRNLESLGRGKKQLVLWLDCDRQGEAIAFEVLEIIKKVNPAISIKRARFAAVTKQDIMRAYSNLTLPNQFEADAVNYRIQIDFRMGCAFTRYQTVLYAKRFILKQNSYLSYGPCQMPTLGFVVDRYLQIKNFKPQKYWVIGAKMILNEKTQVDLKSMRGSIKDEDKAYTILLNMQQNKSDKGKVRGRILQRNKNQKKKYRPYPLTTVQFQKLATDKLKISSAEAMKIAQQLYMKGFISYPRTETNSFPPTMHVPQLVKRLENTTEFGGYVNKLLEGGKFAKPKVGNQNDQAHAPIHPVKPTEKGALTLDEWKVYDLIARHFLACCSKDAIGVESQIIAEIGGEQFKASHLSIKQKNYLQIYPFDRWNESEFPGQIPQYFQVRVEMKENKTSPPGYLTESQLITLMQKNQIGTDSTIHEHIQTIQERQYAIKSSNTFKPTDIGVSLIITYRELGLKIEDCHIRRMMEERMNKIAEGQITKEKAILDTLSQVTPIYEQLRRMQTRWLDEIAQALQVHKGLQKVGIDRSINNRLNNSEQQAQSNNGLVCYGCRKPGHVITNCPQRLNNNPRREVPQVRNQNHGEKKSLFCYHCKQPGHSINQCPQKNKKQYQGQKLQTRKFACFTCGEQGHFAPDCPKKRNQKQADENTSFSKQVCYLCKKEGHFANTCIKKNQRYREDDIKKKEPKRQNPKKICELCGVEGRHSRDSNCPAKKRGKKVVSEESPNYD